MANSFDVLKEMARRNGKIQLSPLGNVVNARVLKKSAQVTIGVGDPGIVTQIALGNVVGGLLVADKAEFDLIAAELDAAVNTEAKPPDGGAQPTKKESFL